MALSTQEREDVFVLIKSEAASSRSAELLRLLYDMNFSTNAERLNAVRTFLDGLITKADADLVAHDAAMTAEKTKKQAERDRLAALRAAV